MSDFPRCNNRHPCVDEFYSVSIDQLLNFVFGQSRLWKFLHGLVALPVETVRIVRNIHLYDCSTSWVDLNIVSL